MPKSLEEILNEYNKEISNQKSENNLTFGVSINEKFSASETLGITPSTKAAKTKVPGVDKEDAASSAGRGQFLVKNVKDNLRSLGFTVSDLDKQKPIDLLKVAPFGFKFSLLWPEENEWGEKNYVKLSINGKPVDGDRISTRAKVKNPDMGGQLLLSTKLGPDIIFIDPSELLGTWGSGEGKLAPGKKGENYRRMLEEGKTYKVQIDSDVIVGGKSEESGEEEEIKEVPIPEEISSGKNRNEIFRLLLKGFGKYNGPVVYGDGFKDIDTARAYSKLQREVKAGKENKEKLKDFRDKAGRDAYSMMVSNLRKSFPNNFLINIRKAFPEFNIQFTKQKVAESYSPQTLLEEDNSDKYKRWDFVFPVRIVGEKTIDNLDMNIREFMVAVKKWFAVPVIGNDGKKRSYNVDYDEDKVNQYWDNFYGKKNESKLSLLNILNEMLIKEEQTIDKDTPNFPKFFLLKIDNGGLDTIDEDTEAVESRERGGDSNTGGFIDAIIVKTGNLFDINKTEFKERDLEVKPGYANSGKAATNKEGKINIDIEYQPSSGGTFKVTKGIMEIKNENQINLLLDQIIKSGTMRIKKSQKDSNYTIFYYPSQTELGKNINNTWGTVI